MKLTIITPTLNADAYLERAIQSVLDQACDSFEHLIVDGGSCDGTLAVVRRYPHLKLMCDPGNGIFDAMNQGIRAATGDWIYFLGADDYFADTGVLTDLDSFFESDLDVFYGDIWDAHTHERYDGPFDEVKIHKKNISHQAIFFKRQVFETVGMFDKTYQTYADWDHNMRWMLNPNIRKKYVERMIAVYAGDGFSFHNPDLQFRSDRLYRYLSYGRHELPVWIFLFVWGKELAHGIRQLDWVRIKRALSIPLRS